MKLPAEIKQILLDIEGTTCPVNFVSDVLFPYANDNLLSHLKTHQTDPRIQALLVEIQDTWRQDNSPQALALARTAQERRQIETIEREHSGLTPEEACMYLTWLSRHDRKSTPLKDLQGWIWEAGYRQGDLKAPLFADVPIALQHWQQQKLLLAVYSSGSIHAQKLLYSHTSFGDLTHFFSHWFDTRTGPKNETRSYSIIAEQLHLKPSNILFISDAPSELIAARNAQMLAIFSKRPGNPFLEAEGFTAIESLLELQPVA
ncbi:MAG: acireductone synthase [Cyanobacteriota bacterium]